jgi:ribosome biogenesis GTPase
MRLQNLGWNSYFAAQFERYRDRGLAPARVAFQGKDTFRLYTEIGELWSEIAGRMRHEERSGADFPVCGDWVAAQIVSGDRAVIHAVLPRRTKFSRKEAGDRTREQVLSANIDTVFVVTGLDGDFNVRRMERYLILAGESGADPVLVLNKADLCHDVGSRAAEARVVAGGAPVIALSALADPDIEALRVLIREGETAALLGSSGAGKSTLVNRLLGREVQKTGQVISGTDRGRHTTTSRDLLLLPSGGLVIDTPGMREVQLWIEGEGLGTAFGDIERLAGRCRFRNCRHAGEPGCAVLEAVANRALEAPRLENYRKLQREIEHFSLKREHSANWVEKQRWRKVTGSGTEVRRKAKARQRYW